MILQPGETHTHNFTNLKYNQWVWLQLIYTNNSISLILYCPILFTYIEFRSGSNSEHKISTYANITDIIKIWLF